MKTELGKLNDALNRADVAIKNVGLTARIASLEAELEAERRKNEFLTKSTGNEVKSRNDFYELPEEPIKVAEMLIYATGTCETSSVARAFGAGDTQTYDIYSKSDLRQIAEHLLVYCNNSEVES